MNQRITFNDGDFVSHSRLDLPQSDAKNEAAWQAAEGGLQKILNPQRSGVFETPTFLINNRRNEVPGEEFVVRGDD